MLPLIPSFEIVKREVEYIREEVGDRLGSDLID